MKEALEDMVYQFGYRTVIDNRPAIITGGLSAIESAFSALGWNNPHYIEEEGNTCEISGCMEPSTSGLRWGILYLSLCHKHSRMAWDKERRPAVKKYAEDRELKRDKTTRYLP